MRQILSYRGQGQFDFEFLALHKPMLLIPLSAQKSRGDQILNANLFKRQGYGEVLQEDELTKESFIKSVHTLSTRKSEMTATMEKTQRPKTPDEMAKLILQFKNRKSYVFCHRRQNT